MEREMLDKLIEQEIKIKELKEENFALKSLLNVEQHDDLQDRINKAIEYVESSITAKNDLTTLMKNNLIVADCDGDIENLDFLLNILKGEDK